MLFERAILNRPTVRKANDAHQRKYPALRAFQSDPVNTNQFELIMNAAAATHADVR